MKNLQHKNRKRDAGKARVVTTAVPDRITIRVSNVERALLSRLPTPANPVNLQPHGLYSAYVHRILEQALLARVEATQRKGGKP